MMSRTAGHLDTTYHFVQMATSRPSEESSNSCLPISQPSTPNACGSLGGAGPPSAHSGQQQHRRLRVSLAGPPHLTAPSDLRQAPMDPASLHCPWAGAVHKPWDRLPVGGRRGPSAGAASRPQGTAVPETSVKHSRMVGWAPAGPPAPIQGRSAIPISVGVWGSTSPAPACLLHTVLDRTADVTALAQQRCRGCSAWEKLNARALNSNGAVSGRLRRPCVIACCASHRGRQCRPATQRTADTSRAARPPGACFAPSRLRILIRLRHCNPVARRQPLRFHRCCCRRRRHHLPSPLPPHCLACRDGQPAPVPVTMLSGFLGAGRHCWQG